MAYRRIVYINGQIQVAFIVGKSKVAPLKSLSISRLELQTAVIGVRLAGSTQTDLEVQFDYRKFWSDSHLYQTFVSHRLGEINEPSNSNEWAWISSNDNSADHATKIKATSYYDGLRWLTGPIFFNRHMKQCLKEPRLIQPPSELICMSKKTVELSEM